MEKVTITEALVEQLIHISYAAGKAILDIYKKDDLGIEKKPDASPVTLADMEANKIICEGLARISPFIPIISEENELQDYETRKSWTQCWIIDPLDGTKEFIKKNGEFTTNIALIEGGIPIVGVVYAPNSDDLYWAAKDFGAYRRDHDENSRIKSAPFDETASGIKVVCSRSHLGPSTLDYAARFDKPEYIRMGSSLKMMAIAEGRADIYPKFGPINEWDVAASQIIIEEAGGSVNAASDGSPVIYNKESMLMPHFIAKGAV